MALVCLLATVRSSTNEAVHIRGVWTAASPPFPLWFYAKQSREYDAKNRSYVLRGSRRLGARSESRGRPGTFLS
jgi:hypothetical protein